jgi:hypothetical protein
VGAKLLDRSLFAPTPSCDHAGVELLGEEFFSPSPWQYRSWRSPPHPFRTSRRHDGTVFHKYFRSLQAWDLRVLQERPRVSPSLGVGDSECQSHFAAPPVHGCLRGGGKQAGAPSADPAEDSLETRHRLRSKAFPAVLTRALAAKRCSSNADIASECIDIEVHAA